MVHKVMGIEPGTAGGVFAYLDEVSHGRRGDERYLNEDGRAVSSWRSGGTVPPIEGAVNAAQFERLLAGADPVTGAGLLSDRSAAGRRLLGWSGVLAAPLEVTHLAHHGDGMFVASGPDAGREVWRAPRIPAVDTANIH